jgi:hypothetical protein
MIRKFKNITSLLLLLVFLLPSIVKLEHHHVLLVSKATNGKHLQIQHDKCVICNFEFSVFLSGTGDIDYQKEKPLEYFCNNYDSEYFSNLSQFSFLLRAPPILTNNI